MDGLAVDALVAGFLGTAIWRGWRRGLIRGIARIVGLLVAAVAAALLHAPVATVLGSAGVPEAYDDLAAALLVFAAVVLGFRFAGNAVAKGLRFTKVGTLADGGAGAALGGIWALTLSSLVLLGIGLFDGSTAAKAVERSTLGQAVADTAPEVAGAVTSFDVRRWLVQVLRPEETERTPDETRRDSKGNRA